MLLACKTTKQFDNETNPPMHETTTEIDKIVNKFLENDANVGVAIATINNGQVQYHNYGFTSKEATDPITESSVFEIGSITKTFTTTILVEMIRENLISLDDPISKYLPDGVANWDPSLSISVQELATHMSGLPRLPGNLFETTTDMTNPYSNYNPENLYTFLKQYTPAAKAERKSEYSNLGVGMLGHILELISESTYEELVAKYISQPLKMSNSKIILSDSELENLVIGHDEKGNATSLWDLPSPLSGAGAIRSTTSDMVKFLEAHMVNELWKTAHDPLAPMMPGISTGLAWVVMPMDQKTIVWHNGGTGGFTSFCGIDHENNQAVIVLNSSTSSIDELGIYILNSLSQ